MPRFLGELPAWPEVEEELKKRQADPATIANYRSRYWEDYAGTEEIKALPSVQLEAMRSRFLQEPVQPFEPDLNLIEKVAGLISPPGLPPAAPITAPPSLDRWAPRTGKPCGSQQSGTSDGLWVADGNPIQNPSRRHGVVPPRTAGAGPYLSSHII